MNLIRCAILLTTLCACGLATAADFTGYWYAETVVGSHSILLIQRGDKVCGRWDEGTHQKSWDGWLYGEVKGNKLIAQQCEEPNFHPDAPEPGDCPDHGLHEYEMKHRQLIDIQYDMKGRRSVYDALDYTGSGVPKDGIYNEDQDLRDYCFDHSGIILQGGMNDRVLQKAVKAKK